MHSLRHGQVGHAVIQVTDEIVGGSESVGAMDDDFSFVVQPFDESVINGLAKIIKYPLFMAS